MKANFAKGRQSFELSGTELNGTGLFFYEISDGKNAAVRKLVVRD
jgi:hypothetical protein